MEKTSAAAALLALAKGGEHRTKMGRLRELLPEIEAAQIAGNTNKTIVETLNAQGLDITVASFPTMLHRARKGMKKTVTTATPEMHKQAETVNTPERQYPPAAGMDKGSDVKKPERPAKPEKTFVTKTENGEKGPPTQQQLKELSRSNFDLSQYEDEE